MFFAGVLSEDYLATAVFVDDIDELFDSFNSVKHGASGKPLRSPISDKSPHIGHWTKASMGIKSWIFEVSHPVVCSIPIVQCIK